MDAYTGPVCYQDGWHHTVTVDDHGHEQPGERLHSDGNGGYRLAIDGDPSHHDQFHNRYAVLLPELTLEQVDELRETLLRQRSGGE